MASLPFRRRRSLQRNQHGPAAQPGALIFPGWVRSFHAILKREQAQAIAKVREALAGEISGLASSIREDRADLAELRYRVTRVEGSIVPSGPDKGPDNDPSDPGGDPVDAVTTTGPARLHLVPQQQGRRTNSAA